MRAKKKTCCLVLEVMRLHNLKLLHGNDAFDAFEVMRPHNLKLVWERFFHTCFLPCGDGSTSVTFLVFLLPSYLLLHGGKGDFLPGKLEKNKVGILNFGEGNGTPLQYSCLENPMD